VRAHCRRLIAALAIAMAGVVASAAAQAVAPAPAGPATAAPAPAPTPEGPVRVTATPSKSDVTVGETLTLELKAAGPEGTTYTFPGEASTDVLELRTPADAGASAPTAPGTHRYEVAVFALGRAVVPPIPVRYRLADGTAGEAASAPVALRVVSLLPKGEEPKLADVRPPVPVGIGRAFWIALAVALTLVSALVVWLLRRRRRKLAPAAAPAPPVAPDVEALRALDGLQAQGLPARGEHRVFYIALTAVAKRYLERRLGAPILEMTTAETLAFLRGHPQADGLHPVVRDVAEAADRIKFARGEGLTAEAERHLAAMRALVHTLEARMAPPPETGEGKAA
jgi:hypothetical protein